MTTYLWNPPPLMSLPVRGKAERLPINRLFFVGRNYHAHAVEMGKPGDRLGTANHPGKADRADRFVRRAPGRPRDTGYRQRHLGATGHQRAECHLRRHLFADCTLRGQGLRADAERLLFGLVRVGDESALEPLAAARGGREHLGDPAAGARFGARQTQPATPEPGADLRRKLREIGIHQPSTFTARASTSKV